MATLDGVQLPDELVEDLKRRAKLRGLSLQEQLVRDLSLARERDPAAEEALLREIREEREKLAARGVHLTDEFLDRSKRWGRE